MYEDTALHINMKNEEKRRHCNADWKPTRDNNAKLQIYDLIMTIITDVIITATKL